MPSFPLVDTHLHLWDPATLHYPWLEQVPPLNRRFGVDDFRAACGDVAVAQMVFVQCDCRPEQALAEADWVAAAAARDPRLRGLVAFAPLEHGDAVAAHLAQLAARPLVKGVRRLLQSEPDPEFCLRPDFVRGVRALARHGFTFDLCLKHPQLSGAIRLVRHCPEVRFVLDHLGKPDAKAGLLDPWRAELRELAALPNVSCKISGLVTEADHARWTAADLQPYLAHACECFGFDRVLFGGDWPVSTLATDYPRWVQTLDAALDQLGATADERHRLYVRNAEQIYRL